MEQLTKEEKLLSHEHFGLATGGGLLAGLIGAAAWAALTVTTKVQFGYAAIGVGFLVGIGIRYTGAGLLSRFQVLAAALGVLSCLLGNMFSELGFYSVEQNMSFWDAMAMYSFVEMFEYSFSDFGLFDVLFFALAGGAAYRYSLRELSIAEASQYNNEHFDPTPPLAALRAPLAFAGYTLTLMLAGLIIIGYKAERRYYSEAGLLLAKGTYQKGLREGTWQYFNEEGQLIQKGQFQQDVAHGPWEWYHAAGQLSIKQDFSYGNEHGLYTRYYEDGSVIDSGQYYYGLKWGEWREYYQNGQLLAHGHYKLNHKHGKWTYYYENGQLEAEAHYDDDDLNGSFESYHPNGKAAVVIRLDGDRRFFGFVADSNGRVLVSEGTGYYEDVLPEWFSLGSGKVSDSMAVGFWTKIENDYLKIVFLFREGEKQVYEIWDERQQPAKLMVEKGKGTFEDYYESGNLYVRGAYKNGLKTGEWLVYHDEPDQISRRSNFRNGLNEGVVEGYSADGTVEFVSNYRNDILEGLTSWFHSSGELSAEATFEQGLKQGEQRSYDDWGRLIRIEHYDRDELIGIVLPLASGKAANPALP